MAPRFFTLAAVIASLGTACGREPTSGERPGGVRERWHQAQPGWGKARPAVSDGLVYFGTGEGQVIARDVRTGAARWAARISNRDAIRGANFVVRAGVVVAPAVIHASGIDAATGQVRWHYSPPPDTLAAGPAAQPGSVVQSRIDADDQTVFLPAWGASVSAVNLQTGAARWVWTPGRSAGDTAASGRAFRSGASGVRVSGDTVFAVGWHFLDDLGLRSEPWLVALEKGTGRELWRVTLPSITGGVCSFGAPVVYRNLVVLATVGGDVWAVDRATRQLAWRYAAAPEFATFTGPELYGDALYIDGGNRSVYALRADNGAVLWKGDAGRNAAADLLATEKYVYYPRGDSLMIFDRATGRRRAAVPQPRTTDPLFASPAAYANGQVFITVAGAAWSFDEP